MARKAALDIVEPESPTLPETPAPTMDQIRAAVTLTDKDGGTMLEPLKGEACFVRRVAGSREIPIQLIMRDLQAAFPAAKFVFKKV
jgi:hypothetical protein